jgi:hypothetical protein
MLFPIGISVVDGVDPGDVLDSDPAPVTNGRSIHLTEWVLYRRSGRECTPETQSAPLNPSGVALRSGLEAEVSR